jgi:hypothetical protein
MQEKIKHGRIAVYSDAFGSVAPLDVHSLLKSKDAVRSDGHLEIRSSTINAGDAQFMNLDFLTWLPGAAKAYEISRNIEDYIFVPVITMPSDLPNRNGVGFPLRELTAFSIDEGCLAYQTFKGKRVHVEHKNDVPTESLGAIADVSLRKLNGYGGGKVWKLVELLAIDRSKNPTYAQMVLSGERNTYSMGAWVDGYTCSVCNAELGKCGHLSVKNARDFHEVDGKLAFRQVYGIKGFETSIVETPAYVSAISDRIMSFS